MESQIPDDDEQEASLCDTDWDNRILCSDDNCIGVIGPDGHCKECGKKYEGGLPVTGAADREILPPEPEEDGSRDTADKDAQPQSTADSTSGEIAESDDWANRQLCSDGNCIGVIGPDGRCKECGKS